MRGVFFMSKKVDLIGRRFGRLLVIEEAPSKKCKNGYHVMWRCKCDCGNIKDIHSVSLTRTTKPTRSCGCFCKDRGREANTVHNYNRRGLKYSTYGIWQGMIQRCTNPNHKSYKNYGGRGIKVCDRWRHSFINFLEDMGECPVGKSIERINNDGDYTPENCKWVTREEQNNNHRRNVVITYNGVSQNLTQWARIIEVTAKLLGQRLRNGWSIEEALTTPVGKRRGK